MTVGAAWADAPVTPPAATSPEGFAPITALDVVPGPDGSASLTWTPDLLPLRGHYPGFPIVPGVFLVDTAERAARLVLGLTHERWSGVTSTRFLSPVFPGETTAVDVTTTSPAEGGLVARCRVRVGERPVATVILRFDGPSPDSLESVESVGTTGATDGTGRDVAAVLPHRWPMLLVDRVLRASPGAALVAQKAVGVQDWVYAEGSTTRAFPWALVIESWCQSAGVLAAWDRPNPDVLTGDVMLFGGITDLTFGEPVVPGDVLEHHVFLERDLGDVVMMTGRSTAGGRTVLEVGRITMAMRPAHVLRPADSPVMTQGDEKR